ncbi:MAG: aminotransferase class I/II-fold pyridoxal phosphate-dependent enzyme, partial [Mycobacterium sp.]|nr:aminotransferase class I/II-fold pyridoxal phosphate-dependent enzyme [Mycobacterium sp.]
MPVQYSIKGAGAEAIATNIEEAVSTGALAPGAKLPPIRELAAQLGVNANTVAAAYRLLRQRGAVETAGRRGTRVRDRPATTPRSLRGLAVPHGVRDLSTGNPDPRLLPIATAQRRDAGSARRRTPLLYGEPAVSAELAEYAQASLTADAVAAEHLAVTAGALDGIERVLVAHLRPGDLVAVEDPGWANLLDLLAALGFSIEPVRVDDDGPLAVDVAEALSRGARALVVTTRAQNPTGAAVTAERANELRELLTERADDVLLIEDDHCAGIAGAPLHALAGTTRHWAFVRSAAKAYGPDLRLAILAGDRRTVERVHGRLRLGPGWISYLLQDVAVDLWRDKAATRLVQDAEAGYIRKRALLHTALANRGVTSHSRSGLNVWIPVPDETVAIPRLLSAGWAAAPGTRFR